LARQLKTYRTSAGFFDLAVAAPSMKAALEAWGSRANLFHQGFARETRDAAVVAATMARPGVVLRRPVGSNAAFREESELPQSLPVARAKQRKQAKAKAAPRSDAKPSREATASFERERKQRERARLKEEQAEARADAKRERAVAKATAALEKARKQHDDKRAAIEAAKAALDRRTQAEDTRWAKQRAGLETALRRARRP
jgi:hypothetical protein